MPHNGELHDLEEFIEKLYAFPDKKPSYFQALVAVLDGAMVNWSMCARPRLPSERKSAAEAELTNVGLLAALFFTVCIAPVVADPMSVIPTAENLNPTIFYFLWGCAAFHGALSVFVGVGVLLLVTSLDPNQCVAFLDKIGPMLHVPLMLFYVMMGTLPIGLAHTLWFAVDRMAFFAVLAYGCIVIVTLAAFYLTTVRNLWVVLDRDRRRAGGRDHPASNDSEGGTRTSLLTGVAL